MEQHKKEKILICELYLASNFCLGYFEKEQELPDFFDEVYFFDTHTDSKLDNTRENSSKLRK